MSVSPKSPVRGSLFRFGAPLSRENSDSSTTLRFGVLAVKSPIAAKEVIDVDAVKEVVKPKKTIKKPKIARSTTIKTIGLLYNKGGKWFVPPRAQFSFNGLDDKMKVKVEEKIAELEAMAVEEDVETFRFETTGESSIVPSNIGGIDRGFLKIPH